MHPRRLLACALAGTLAGLALAQPKLDLPAVNPANAKLARAVEGLTSPATSIAFVPGKNLVLVGCEDGSLRVWAREEGKDLLAGAQAQTLKAHDRFLTALAAAGNLAATASTDGKVHVWELPADRPARTLTAGAPVRALALSADAKVLASGGDDNAVGLYDPAAAKLTRKLTGPGDRVTAVTLSPDAKLVAAAGHDGKLWLWEVESGNKRFDALAQAPPPPNAPVTANVASSLAFSPDGKSIALGGSDGRIYLFDPANGKLIRQLQGHTLTVTGLAFHPGGALLVSCSKDRSVRLWNPQAGAPIKTLEGHTAWAEGVTLAEQGTLALSAGADRSVRVWDLGAAPAKPPGKK